MFWRSLLVSYFLLNHWHLHLCLSSHTKQALKGEKKLSPKFCFISFLCLFNFKNFKSEMKAFLSQLKMSFSVSGVVGYTRILHVPTPPHLAVGAVHLGQGGGLWLLPLPQGKTRSWGSGGGRMSSWFTSAWHKSCVHGLQPQTSQQSCPLLPPPPEPASCLGKVLLENVPGIRAGS